MCKLMCERSNSRCACLKLKYNIAVEMKFSWSEEYKLVWDRKVKVIFLVNIQQNIILLMSSKRAGLFHKPRKHELNFSSCESSEILKSSFTSNKKVQ